MQGCLTRCPTATHPQQFSRQDNLPNTNHNTRHIQGQQLTQVRYHRTTHTAQLNASSLNTVPIRSRHPAQLRPTLKSISQSTMPARPSRSLDRAITNHTNLFTDGRYTATNENSLRHKNAEPRHPKYQANNPPHRHRTSRTQRNPHTRNNTREWTPSYTVTKTRACKPSTTLPSTNH